MIIQSIKDWTESPSTKPSPPPISSFVTNLLEEENMQLIHEEMRYIWKVIPFVYSCWFIHLGRSTTDYIQSRRWSSCVFQTYLLYGFIEITI